MNGIEKRSGVATVPARGLALAALALLSGCVSYPPYKAPPPGPDTATIDMSRFSVASLCQKGKAYRVPRTPDGKVVVSTDGRVSVTGIAQFIGFNVTYTCMPSISFRPEAGQSYFMTLRALSEGCEMEVYRLDPAEPRVGLVHVPGIGAGERCE
jgi:hypothetical protein